MHGSQEVVLGPNLEPVCVQVLKNYAKRIPPSRLLFAIGGVNVQFNLENVRIDGITNPLHRMLHHPIKGISLIAVHADDKTVFGYVCSQPCPTGYKLYAFRSHHAKDIIKILNKAVAVANNSRKKAGSSEERPDNFSQETNDQRPTKEKEQEGNVHRVARGLKEKVTMHLQPELGEKALRERNLLEQAREKEQREENLRKQLQEMEQQLTNLRGQLQERNEELRDVRGQLQEKGEETANLQNQLEAKDQEIIELETTLSTAQDELRDYQRQQSPEWVILRDRIQLTGKSLGKGGWGSVVEGKYCGCSVAVKQIHELILSPHNRKLFEREMEIASRCRHPCLLQFIGATNDEGNPLFVTELMETSLRTLLEQRALSEVEISFISLDVALALNYLHQKQPSPIIHRDISSANVLLWRQGECWRAKVSDYGTANFMQQTMTVAPGAMIYSAPEAFTKIQTVKVDVYSFGVLLCEVCIRELPDPQKRVRQVARVKNKLNRALIRRCLESEPGARPSIQEIIDELEEPN